MVYNSIPFSCGQLWERGVEQHRLAGNGAISAPTLLHYQVICSGGGKSVFCRPALPHTVTQNTALEFGLTEPGHNKS